MNILFLLKKDWSPRQRMIINEYKKIGNQNMAAKTLGITHQAVSKVLTGSMWKEISGIEEDLNHVLKYYPKKLSENIKSDKT